MARTSTATHGPRGGSLLDPVVLPVIAAASTVYALHGISGYFERDLGVYAYGAQRLLEGDLPYEGILNRAGPLAHALPAIGVVGARIVGQDDLAGMRVFYLILAVASVALAYYLGRDVFASKVAGLATAAALVTFQGFTYYASYGPREKTPMVLFLLAAFLALAHRRWCTAAVFLSLATLTLQVALPTGIAAMAVCLVFAGGHRWRVVLRYAVGGLVPLVLVVACYVAASNLTVFIDGFVRLNAQNTKASPFLGAAGNNWTGLVAGYGWSLWVLLAGSVAIIAVGVAALLPVFRRRYAWAPMGMAVAAAWVLSAVWGLRDFDNWPDMFPFLPSAAIGVGALAVLVVQKVRSRVAIGVVVALCVVAVAVSGVLSWTGRSTRLLTQEASVEAVFSRLPASATMVSFNAPQVMVLAGRTNPTQHQMFSSGLAGHIKDSWPGGLDGYISDIQAYGPTVVAVEWFETPTWLTPLLADYQFVGRGPGWSWYVSSSVPADTREAIQVALVEVGNRDGP